MKGKLKTIAFLLVLILLCSIIAPTMNVFASTSKTINITSTEIVSHIVLSETSNPEENKINDFLVDPSHPIENKSLDNSTHRYDGEIYVTIEPDFFTGGRITSIKINGVEKDIISPIGRNTYKVSDVEVYNIEVVGLVEQHYNIMWANDGANVAGTDYDNEEVKLVNGSAKVVKVYDNETDMNDISNEIDSIDEGCLNPEGRGYISLSEGNVVIFEFTPKYGYQLTSVTANGMKLTPQETMNQYKYIMPATNIHFQATFTKTEDVVKSSTSKVTSGTIKIGKNEIDSGSTVLSVKDATLTDEQKSIFNNKAGDYTVSNVFDIKLNQVFYKGSTNSNDVWYNPLGYNEDLRTPATITLKLDEGVDGNAVVLIHEKEDGTYETIETTYNEATHTITFKTASFSNYAIASKKTEKNEESMDDNITNPQTGDNITIFITLFVIATLGAFITIKFNKDIK